MPLSAPEMKGKVTVSWYLLISVVILSFTLGGTIATVLDNDQQRAEQEAFLLKEIQGLRDDWNRRYNEDVNKRLEKLEKKHE